MGTIKKLKETALEVFEYNNETGIFIRKIDKKEQKSVDASGYIRISIYGKRYLAHRIAFLINHSILPDAIDHIDKNKSNNSIYNLRDGSGSENHKNMKKRLDNTTGYTGIYMDRRNKYRKYVAEIMHENKKEYLGAFATGEEAYVAKRKREKELGFLSTHGGEV